MQKNDNKLKFIGKPLDFLLVTQEFGVNYVDFYKKFGLKGHNGIDFRCDINTPTYSEIDGTVVSAKYDDGGGNTLIIRSDEISGFCFELRKMHLNKIIVNVGDRVKKNELVAYSGNTGKYTTGPHLHLDLKIVKMGLNGARAVLNYNNGFLGAIDPSPYISPKIGYCEWFRVDERYGRQFSYISEFLMRFKNRWLHKYLINIGINPKNLQQREMQALVYGGWGVDEVFNPSMYPIWTMLKKDEFVKGEKPMLRVTR